MSHAQFEGRHAVVLGGAGFLGSHLSERLVDLGARVTVIDNLITGSEDNIAQLFGRPGFRFVFYDITDFLHVPGDVDYVVHFASPASPIDYLTLADPDAQGRVARHSQGPGDGPGQERPLSARLDQRGVRQSSRQPPTGNVLGKRQPDRSAGCLRRSKTLCRGARPRLPPSTRRSTSASPGSSTRTARA